MNIFHSLPVQRLEDGNKSIDPPLLHSLDSKFEGIAKLQGWTPHGSASFKHMLDGIKMSHVPYTMHKGSTFMHKGSMCMQKGNTCSHEGHKDSMCTHKGSTFSHKCSIC